MDRNKFKSFLAEKEKMVAEENQFNNSNSGSSSGKKRNFISFFSPNKMFIGRTEVTVQVLPNRDQFFFEYSKHMVKCNDTFKQMTCLDENCPLCNCIRDNKDRLDRKTLWQLSAKKVDLMFVFNPYAKQIMKYEVQGQGIVDILRPLNEFIENNPDFDPDKDGFNMTFRQDGKWAKCVSVDYPSLSADEAIKESTNKDDVIDEDFNIRTLESEAVPYSVNTTRKYNNTTTQQILNVFLPGVNVEPYFYEVQEYTPGEYSAVNGVVSVPDNNETKPAPVKRDKRTEFPFGNNVADNDGIGTTVITEEPIVQQTSVFDDNTSSVNDDTQDIRAFLNNRRSRRS